MGKRRQEQAVLAGGEEKENKRSVQDVFTHMREVPVSSVIDRGHLVHEQSW